MFTSAKKIISIIIYKKLYWVKANYPKLSSYKVLSVHTYAEKDWRNNTLIVKMMQKYNNILISLRWEKLDSSIIWMFKNYFYRIKEEDKMKCEKFI